jgi:hypothetical protein
VEEVCRGLKRSDFRKSSVEGFKKELEEIDVAEADSENMGQLTPEKAIEYTEVSPRDPQR